MYGFVASIMKGVRTRNLKVPGCTNPAYAEVTITLILRDDGSCQYINTIAYPERVEDNANLNNPID